MPESLPQKPPKSRIFFHWSVRAIMQAPPHQHPILATIGISFLLSLVIESWQYYAGTGTAQVTDVICNTLEAAIGTLSFLLFSHLQGTPPK